MPGKFATKYFDNSVDLGSTTYNLIERSVLLDQYATLLPTYVAPGLFVCGDNLSGGLGINSTVDRSSPVQVVSGGSNWRSIKSYLSTTAGIKNDCTLWTWGENSGQLGDNTTINKSSPVQITGTNWDSISVGDGYCIALKQDQTMWSWGINSYGNLGDNSTIGKSSPVQIGTQRWARIAASYRASAAIKGTVAQSGLSSTAGGGALWTWGEASGGALGTNNAFFNASSPVQVGALIDWYAVSGGQRYFLALRGNKTLWSWGYGIDGVLGHNDSISKSSPVQIGAGTDWESIAAGLNTAAAIKTDGTLWLWGQNPFGEHGNNTASINKSSPVQTSAGGTMWRQVHIGLYNVACIKTDGTLWAWGRGDYGGNGNNNLIHRSSPVQVGSLTRWKSVSVGLSSFKAILEFGEI